MNTVIFEDLSNTQLKRAFEEINTLLNSGILPPGIVRDSWRKESKINPSVSITWVSNKFLEEMAKRWYSQLNNS